MKDYASMSNFEINKEVSMALLDKPANPSARYVAIGDYCNNPADAWPIIESSYISIQFYQGNWMASVNPSQESGYRSACFIGKNPLKAAMVVFLMMKESEND